MSERDTATETLGLRHLKIELARIDLMLRRAVLRWQRAGQDPDDAFRGLYISDEDAVRLIQRPFASNWGENGQLKSEESERFAQAERELIAQEKALRTEAARTGEALPLRYAAESFQLSRFEVDVLLIALAPNLDLRYEQLYGYLQDDVSKKRPTVNLALDLLCRSAEERLSKLALFDSEQPLFHSRLLNRIRPPDSSHAALLSEVLSLDEGLIGWLLGGYRPHPALDPYARLIRNPGNHTRHRDRVLSDPAQRALKYARASIETEDGYVSPPPLLVFYGPDGTAQAAAARRVAAAWDRPLLDVDLTDLGGQNPREILQLATRDARLTGALLWVRGWDTCLDEDAAEPVLLADLCAHPGPIILGGHRAWRPRGLDRVRRLLWVEFPVPGYRRRRALWQHYLARGDSAEPTNLDTLAGQFVLTSGQIRDAVESARDRAAQRDEPVSGDDLMASARAHSNPRLANLAHKITPRYGWEDIILPEDQLALLREIVSTVRHRPKVLDHWEVGRKLVPNRGVTVLFAGPPGTGKTMAAEIIAAALGLDLYRIDLSTVVSKYIGETEKNIERIFREAEQSNAILFFDEADALFGKRSEVRDAHDRYANIEISYLLQRMEAYDGVTILATNLRGNLDEAFTRRLQFAVNFPFPEAEDRLRIWRTLFPTDVPRDGALDFGYLAERFRLAGGNIRNIIVSAAYLAAADGDRVTMGHLLHGTRRELQKMGRLVREEDLELSEASLDPTVSV